MLFNIVQQFGIEPKQNRLFPSSAIPSIEHVRIDVNLG